MPNTINLTHLDVVFKKTISAVESSKEQIFSIAENARVETLSTREELEKIKKDVIRIIDQTDELERKFRLSRVRLVEVSRNFKKYGEADIQSIYEQASQLQAELSVSREKEQNLRTRRDELERRLKNLTDTIEKAENLMSQIGAVLGYLTGDLRNFSETVKSAQQRQMFAVQIIQAQEEERKRVAREIHDGPAQSMANIVIRSEIAERILDQGKIEEAKEELRSLKDTVRMTLGEVRKIIFDLRPMALDDLGIVPTLRKYMEDFSQRSQIEAELITLGREERLPSSVGVVIFRLIQEAMNNAGKHSQAQNLQVKLEFGSELITGMVKDDGVGFDHIDQTGMPQFGIMGMKERINLLDGKLDIHSHKGKGTRVVFSIPINR